MSERDPALVQEFSTELSEHIATSEQILLQADAGAPSMEEINLLFRSFHSVKGLSRVVNHPSLESLAHESESLLATFRAGTQPFTERAQDLLLQALDAIKTAGAELVEGREYATPEELVRDLRLAVGAGAGTGGQRESTGVSTPAERHPDADLHDDFDTLVALGELFEELLPDISRTLADPSYLPEEQLTEDAALMGFSLEKVNLPALGQVLEQAVLDKTALSYARFLRLLDNYRFLIEKPCGLAESHAAVRSWFRTALLELLEDDRVEEGLNLLAILIPRSPFVTLISALERLECDEQSRTDWRARAALAIRADVEADAPQHSEAAALLAEQIREVLLAPFQIPESSRRFLESKKLDIERFQVLPPALGGRLPVFAKRRTGDFYEALLPLPREAGEIERLIERTHPFLEIVQSESAAVDSVQTLALLFFSTRGEAEIRSALLGQTANSEPFALRKLDGRQPSSHFGFKPQAVAAATGGAQVRVPVELLDSMFGRVGQFFNVSSRFNAMVHDGHALDLLQELFDYSERNAPELVPKIDWLIRQQHDFASLENQAHQLISQIREATLGLRVIPIDTLFSRFPRMIRDTAQKQKKLVRFEARSKGIRVDNAMVELLADPLMHMLRNSVDHGIEPPGERVAAGKPRTASLVLSAEQSGNRIVVEVRDDGRGINIDRVRQKAVASGLVGEEESRTLSDEQIARFIFAPGFSTAEKITDTSGRGVGMDVALVNVTKLGGKIEISTRLGEGTRFQLNMPLSKAIQPMLLAETGVQTVAFPDRIVVEGTLVPANELQNVNGQRSILLHDRFLPLFRLVDLLRLPAPADDGSGLVSVIVCEYGGRRIGVEVHKILRRNDLLIQEMHPRIAHLPGIGGISTLGTDRIVIVIDPEGLFNLARSAAVTGLRNHPAHARESGAS